MIDKELRRAAREKKVLLFAMMDIDFFKQYNDHYGHQKGDVVIAEVATVLQEKLTRGGDYSFRLGGEEFGMLFTDGVTAGAESFVDSIREAVQEKKIEHLWSQVAEVVTVSIGAQYIVPTPDTNMNTVYKMADDALYKAKHAGRNRVVTVKPGQGM